MFWLQAKDAIWVSCIAMMMRGILTLGVLIVVVVNVVIDFEPSWSQLVPVLYHNHVFKKKEQHSKLHGAIVLGRTKSK